MPIVLPHLIKTDSIAVYGRMIGIRKMRYELPSLITIEIHPTDMDFKEQVFIEGVGMEQEGTKKNLDLEEKGYLVTGGSFSDTLDKAETVVFSEGMMLSETPTRAETVVITNE